MEPRRTTDTTGVLDEALQRLHSTGPEFHGWLTNHGPMAVEALVRGGHAADVHHWLDYYRSKLEDPPRPTEPITAGGWQEALGDPRRTADWTEYFVRETGERPWRDVLAQWWPRLLPGIAAGATHPVIRVGHAVRTLLADEADSVEGKAGRPVPIATDGPRLAELAHGLGYWAARSLPTPGLAPLSGPAGPAEALDGVPPIAGQGSGYREGIALLAGTPGWTAASAALRAPATPDEARDLLAELVRAATYRYAAYGHQSPVMLVHSATAPNAVLRTLPALPSELWVPSLGAAWAASAAVTALYSPAAPTPAAELPKPPAGSVAEASEELFARAARHGDEHTVKFADTAVDVAAATGSTDALVAAVRATELIEPAL
ncbi:questin oxidase family protein [Streptomyces sp. RKAG293]|uniref:questin oxidase family protein n=1 Tax=Streptomyces sp. RKAG293 TaxID=2893403 RepID=UPI0020339656|nr:questin oxidase family protein [Streptomyces sp. RKAG293]MCM2419863.1 questin oxidase family protein [Streptomyces sp. RKAG293]